MQLKNEDFVDMDDFYNHNGIKSNKDYSNIIRSGITKSKVFVKRNFQKMAIILSIKTYLILLNQIIFTNIEYVNKSNRGICHL